MLLSSRPAQPSHAGRKGLRPPEQAVHAAAVTDRARTAAMMNETVHAGLRRDIRRFEAVFAEQDPPGTARREALADHVVWLADFLRKHHTGEDTAIWPRVLDKCPELGPLMGELESEHEAMAEALTTFESAATVWRRDGSDESRDAVVASLGTFGTVCVRHLDHEEQEGIPQIAEVLNDEDWEAISKVMRGRAPMSEMGYTLMWMLDDLDPPHTAVLEAQIPRPVMWLLRRRFGPRYNARRAELWAASVAA